MSQSKFHGRFEGADRGCEAPYCDRVGEFRAPGNLRSGFDGPGDYRWFCLAHVREFNAGYDWFEGMNAEEILAAQSPTAGWQTESPAFKSGPGGLGVGVDGMPRWSQFNDPLDAIGARAANIKSRAHRSATMASNERGGFTAQRYNSDEAQALDTMGLGLGTDRRQLRRRYSELVRRYHPDRNGGDRQYETRLGQVVDAYQLLRKSPALS